MDRASILTTALVILPPITYGAGFLMWAGPSMAQYNQNLALSVSPGALILPGIAYVAVLLAAGFSAVVLGTERVVGPVLSRNRSVGTTLEIFYWVTLLLLANGVAHGVATRDLPFVTRFPPFEVAYLVAHVIIVGFGLRRLYGVVVGRFRPRNEERRSSSPYLRAAQAILAIVILYAQVSLALLFSVLGPNPAKEHQEAIITETGRDVRVVLLDETNEYFLVFSPREDTIRRILKGPETQFRLPSPN